MRRLLYPQTVIPVLMLLYAVWGMLFRRDHQIWGMPASVWYTLGSIVAVLVLVIGHMEKE